MSQCVFQVIVRDQGRIENDLIKKKVMITLGYLNIPGS